MIQGVDDKPRWFAPPDEAVLEVPLAHPEHTWWRGLGLRRHAVPALADMCLEIGGICNDRFLWKDRALVELNRSVLHSCARARSVGAGWSWADWSWIVPPISGSATPVFHRTYEEAERHPAYVHHPEARARARGEEADPV